eukprot:926939-Pelagomonas_calceolata.AAC.1
MNFCQSRYGCFSTELLPSAAKVCQSPHWCTNDPRGDDLCGSSRIERRLTLKHLLSSIQLNGSAAPPSKTNFKGVQHFPFATCAGQIVSASLGHLI